MHTSSSSHDYPAVGICPSCHTAISYSPDSVLRNIEDMKLAYGLCQSCQISLLTIDIGHGAMTTSIGFMTDLTREDVGRFWSNTRIQEHDVIALHEMMQKPQELRQFLQYKD